MVNEPAASDGSEAERLEDQWKRVRRAMAMLDAEDLQLVTERLGLDGGDGKALRDIGSTRGISKETVRLRIKTSLEKMRPALTV